MSKSLGQIPGCMGSASLIPSPDSLLPYSLWKEALIAHMSSTGMPVVQPGLLSETASSEAGRNFWGHAAMGHKVTILCNCEYVQPRTHQSRDIVTVRSQP